MTLDLETRPVGTPMRLARPAPAPAPASPPAVSGSSDGPPSTSPASQPSSNNVVDLTDHAASYWVRRRRAQEAAEH
ncbi:MAG: hypothetical protein QOJ11_3765 [Frankiales bacterium]|jgi:hypothetical protein|nr:hypothetical protein [Frankiales bacterium]